MVFVSTSRIYGQTAAVCGRERLCSALSTPPGVRDAASPAAAGTALRGIGLHSALGRGSRGQEEGGSGVRRRDEAWA